MTLEDAIAEQQLYLNHSDQWSHERLDQALRLGIEALKRQEARRKLYSDSYYQPLPGETED